jgi:hypothetical protein
MQDPNHESKFNPKYQSDPDSDTVAEDNSDYQVKDGKHPKALDMLTLNGKVIDLRNCIKSQPDTGKAYACTVSDVIEIEHGSTQQEGTQSVDRSSMMVPMSNFSSNKSKQTLDEHANIAPGAKPTWLKICKNEFMAQYLPENETLHNENNLTMDSKGTRSDTDTMCTLENESDDKTSKEETPKTHEEKKARLKAALALRQSL